MHQQSVGTNSNDLPLVSIALATYNGSAYLGELLDSIEAQTYANIEIIVADDCSTDDTRSLLLTRRWLRPHQVLDTVQRAGVVGNFSRALDACNGRYLAFADQDDWWHPTKIAELVKRVAAFEDATGSQAPVLVFSDIEIVDANLVRVEESFFLRGYQSSECRRLADFLIVNHVPGCAMLFNRALLDRALPFPAGLFMHDWWLCMVAVAFGRIDFVDSPLIKYRQHGGNVVGAKGRRSSTGQKLSNIFRPSAWANWFAFIRPPEESVRVSALNIALFEQRFRQQLPIAAAGDMHLFKRGGTNLIAAIRFAATAKTGERFLYSVAFMKAAKASSRLLETSIR
jgi:glycosyltransferase involved in cell wall biosynthesis